MSQRELAFNKKENTKQTRNRHKMDTKRTAILEVYVLKTVGGTGHIKDLLNKKMKLTDF